MKFGGGSNEFTHVNLIRISLAGEELIYLPITILIYMTGRDLLAITHLCWEALLANIIINLSA